MQRSRGAPSRMKNENLIKHGKEKKGRYLKSSMNSINVTLPSLSSCLAYFFLSFPSSSSCFPHILLISRPRAKLCLEGCYIHALSNQHLQLTEGIPASHILPQAYIDSSPLTDADFLHLLTLPSKRSHSDVTKRKSKSRLRSEICRRIPFPKW